MTPDHIREIERNDKLIESLQWLAGAERLKYGYRGWERGDEFAWVSDGQWRNWKLIDALTQDDIDEILAGINIEYEIRMYDNGTDVRQWKPCLFSKENPPAWFKFAPLATSKSAAAVGALIAGIGKYRKEKG